MKVVDWNEACLAKVIWILFEAKDTMWIAWVNLNLLKGRCFWTVKSSANNSWCWKKFLKLRLEVRQMIAYKVGNGQNIFL